MDNPDVTALLGNQLAPLLPVVVLGMRMLYKYLAESDTKPTIPRWVFLVANVVAAFGLAYAGKGFASAPPANLIEAWYSQGFVFAVAALVADGVAASAYAEVKAPPAP